jgi:hypothetical protein
VALNTVFNVPDCFAVPEQDISRRRLFRHSFIPHGSNLLPKFGTDFPYLEGGYTQNWIKRIGLSIALEAL